MRCSSSGVSEPSASTFGASFTKDFSKGTVMPSAVVWACWSGTKVSRAPNRPVFTVMKVGSLVTSSR